MVNNIIDGEKFSHLQEFYSHFPYIFLRSDSIKSHEDMMRLGVVTEVSQMYYHRKGCKKFSDELGLERANSKRV